VAPVHELPWYFGATAFGIWAAAATGFTLLLRRRIKAKAERRRNMSRRAPGRDDRALGP